MRSLSVLSSLFVFFSAQVVHAQELQSGSTSDSGERAGGVSESTENINTGRGAFLGLGGQKPMQRVNSIPLPTRQNRMAANAVGGQPLIPRDASPSFAARRSKPLMGELTTDFPARMIYLNGKNISTVREQQLDGVSVRIDAQGNIHISAPHYEVQESTHYRPLLPQELPRVSKPKPTAESLLNSGRYSKPEPSLRKEASAPAASVPPVESEDADGTEESATQSAGSGSAGTSKSATSPKAPSPGAGDNR